MTAINRASETRNLKQNELNLLNRLHELDNRFPDLLIVVEGRRDEDVLRDIGVKARILKTQCGQARPELLDSIVREAGTNGQVLILTDFDREGDELAHFIKEGLEINKVKTLRGERKRIRRLMAPLRCIEEIVSLFKMNDFTDWLNRFQK